MENLNSHLFLQASHIEQKESSVDFSIGLFALRSDNFSPWKMDLSTQIEKFKVQDH